MKTLVADHYRIKNNRISLNNCAQNESPTLWETRIFNSNVTV